MDQPTAEQALARLEPLVGEWTLEAIGPDGRPWPGEARATIEWHDSRAHLIQRWSVDMPEAPDGVALIGCDAANGTYMQLYSDERGVCRIYQMSIDEREWRLWREGEPFAQRFAYACEYLCTGFAKFLFRCRGNSRNHLSRLMIQGRHRR